MNRFWLSPSCQKHFCTHHWEVAIKRFPSADKQQANERLLWQGWIRCTMDAGELFYERRLIPTEKQMAELKDYALENDLRCYDDSGRVTA